MLSIYRIRDMAREGGRAVYSIQQLANLTGKKKSIANVYASRLATKGLATRLVRGKLAFTSDLQAIATQLLEPSYISLYSALNFHGLLMQVPREIECVTPKNSRNYKELGIAYHKIPARLFYGYERHGREGGYVFVADPEKALVDGVYLNRLPRSLIAEVKGKVDGRKLAEYVGRYEGRGKKKLERWLL